ncbi:MAG TPA: response regulator transcription factor [Candidatus Acidoferrales bacterium]|nr:response regulator transcription factor [Candidatus Acidoferrales bacterium]
MKNSANKPKARARVLLVDDHPMVRRGLTELLNRTGDFHCCGEAESAVEAQKALSELKPDLVLLDLRLRNSDGLDLLKDFKLQDPAVKVLVLSQLDEMTYAERALHAGAMGYVMKENATEEIMTAMRQVLAGELYVSPRVHALAVRRMAGVKNNAADNRASFVEMLTDRELQILQLLGQGVSTREIAADLCLSFKTIETHRENIKRKLGLKDAAALVYQATLWVRNEGRKAE